MTRTANRPQVLDLFCGCGGFSLGAARAGFSLAGAVDNDSRAIRSHAQNFPETAHINADLSRIGGRTLLKKLGLEGSTINGIIGGPPCQGFSTIGKRDVSDSRSRLFGHFFRLVNEIQPEFFVCENVPGILNDRFHRVRESAIRMVKTDYQILPATKISANEFGAPTTRARVFIVGYRRDSGVDLDADLFAAPSRMSKVHVKDALGGLPKSIHSEWQNADQGWRKVRSIKSASYFGKRVSGIIPKNVGDPHAIRKLRLERLVSGCLGTRHTADVIERLSKLSQGDTDLVSRFPRLDLKDFCPTIRAGTGADKGSHQAARPIHPTENRVITPREAARLQGFPDWFQFDDTKWHSFRQIGNSVCPLVAERILCRILSAINANINIKGQLIA